MDGISIQNRYVAQSMMQKYNIGDGPIIPVRNMERIKKHIFNGKNTSLGKNDDLQYP